MPTRGYPLPAELLHDVAVQPLFSYLHEIFLESSMSIAMHPGWTGLRNLLKASSVLRAVTIQVLKEAFGLDDGKCKNNVLEEIQTRIDNLRAVILGKNSQTLYQLAGVYDVPTHLFPCSQYMKAYYLYTLGVHVGKDFLKDFNPVLANMQTWSVHHWQLSPGIQILANAWDFCGYITNPTFVIEIEPAIVQEIMRQLYFRQLQIWKWSLIRVFYLLPTGSGEVRESIIGSILKLLDRIKKYETLSPVELGYQYIQHARVIPFSRFNIAKLTRNMVMDSDIFGTVQTFLAWKDEPGGTPPAWREPLNCILQIWEDLS